MKKQARNSKRNRHTGRINHFKQQVINKGARYEDGNKVYLIAGRYPHLNIVRVA